MAPSPEFGLDVKLNQKMNSRPDGTPKPESKSKVTGRAANRGLPSTMTSYITNN